VIDLCGRAASRGRGVGASLIAGFIDWLGDRSALATVGTQAGNPALRLYARCGFVPTATHVTITCGSTDDARLRAQARARLRLAAGGLVAIAPAMAAIAAAIALDSPGGVFYRQDRLGRGGRTFRLLKFARCGTRRSGTTPTARPGSTPAMIASPVGRWLRGAPTSCPS